MDTTTCTAAPSPSLESHRDVLLAALRCQASGAELGGPYVDGLRRDLRALVAGEPMKSTTPQLFDGLVFELKSGYCFRYRSFPEGTWEALEALFGSVPALAERLTLLKARYQVLRSNGTLSPFSY